LLNEYNLSGFSGKKAQPSWLRLFDVNDLFDVRPTISGGAESAGDVVALTMVA
jgi:hypothetical protein